MLLLTKVWICSARPGKWPIYGFGSEHLVLALGCSCFLGVSRGGLFSVRGVSPFCFDRGRIVVTHQLKVPRDGIYCRFDLGGNLFCLPTAQQARGSGVIGDSSFLQSSGGRSMFPRLLQLICTFFFILVADPKQAFKSTSPTPSITGRNDAHHGIAQPEMV